MRYAETRKMMSQKKGSIVEGIKNTVPTPIAKPNSESCKTSFQFIVPSRVGCRSIVAVHQHAIMGRGESNRVSWNVSYPQKKSGIDRPLEEFYHREADSFEPNTCEPQRSGSLRADHRAVARRRVYACATSPSR